MASSAPLNWQGTKRRFAATIVIPVLGFVALTAMANTAVEPVIRLNNEPWMNRHLALSKMAATMTDCRVLFLGDSLMMHWLGKAPEIWEEQYAPLNALNFGQSGDRTQHLLWRLQNGQIGNLKPEVVILLIGTNNIGFNSDKVTRRNSPPEIAEGIAANVQYLREQLPDTKILLLALFPRDENDSKNRSDVNEVNGLIADLHDGGQVIFLDIGSRFLKPDGTLPETLMPDLLHPNTAGYAIWADAMREPLAKLLEE